MQYLLAVLTGLVSWYSLPGSIMADQKPFQPSAKTCAMLYLPFGTKVRVENLENNRVAFCVVTDRGPHEPGRIIDVTPFVRDQLKLTKDGVARVSVSVCRREPETSACNDPRHCVINHLPGPARTVCY
jgi:rare lipoprotein A